MKRFLVTAITIILASMWLVPWPWILGPMMRPHLRGEVPPEDLRFMSELAVVFTVYPVLLILIITFVTAAVIMHKRAAKEHDRGVKPTPRATAEQLTAAERRERERRRRHAQAGGDIAMALMLMEDKKK